MGESLHAARHPAGQCAHPARRSRARRSGGGRPALRGGDPRGRRHRPAAPRHRAHGAHRVQRARLGRREPDPAGHPGPGHATGRRRRLLRRGERPPRGGHHGCGHDSRGPRDPHSRHRRAQGRDRPPGGRGRGRLRGRGDVPATPPEHHVLHRPRRRRRPHPRGDAVAARRGRVDARADGPRRRVALAPGGEGHPQAHPAGLRRAPAVVARGAARLAGRAQRRRLQRARLQDPRTLEAAARPAGDLLLAPPGRRRDLDGRDPPEAGRERERDHGRLHDQRERGGLRSRRAPASRLPAAAGSRAAPGRRSSRRPGTAGGRVPGVEDAGRRRHPRSAGRQAHHPGDRGHRRHPHARAPGRRRTLPQPAVLPDGHGAEGSGRPGRCGDRARAARGAGARSGLRGRRPLGPARDAPDVQGGDRARAWPSTRRRADGGPRCGCIGARGRSGR